MVVVPQNNYAHDEEWCNTCNAGHYWLDCAHVLGARKQGVLKVQQITTQREVYHNQAQQQGNPYATLITFSEDGAIIVANFDQNQVWRPESAGTRSKTQATNVRQEVDKAK